MKKTILTRVLALIGAVIVVVSVMVVPSFAAESSQSLEEIYNADLLTYFYGSTYKMYFPDTSYGDVSADCIITSDLAMRAAMDVGFIGSSRRWEVLYFTSVFIIYHQQVVGENVYREVTFSFDGVDRFISYNKEYVSGDDYILKVRVGSGFELAGEYDWGKYSSKPECHIKL